MAQLSPTATAAIEDSAHVGVGVGVAVEGDERVVLHQRGGEADEARGGTLSATSVTRP